MNPLPLSGSIEQAIGKSNDKQQWRTSKLWKKSNRNQSQSVAPARLSTALLANFAGIALLLAAVGIYGVVSYSVAQRPRELAVHLALGALLGDLLNLVIGKTMLTVLVGLALGAGVAFALTRDGELALRYKPNGSADIGRY